MDIHLRALLRMDARSACYRLLFVMAIASTCIAEVRAMPTVPIPAVEQQQRGWGILRQSAATYGRMHTFDCNISTRTTTTVLGKKPDNRQGTLRIAWQFPDQSRVKWKEMASHLSITTIYTANSKVGSILMTSNIASSMPLNTSQTVSHHINKGEAAST